MRRRILILGSIFSIPALKTEALMNKKNINQFGEIFESLKDDGLREKKFGQSLIIVENAIFSGEPFKGVIWSNIIFKNCDFFGMYEIAPKNSINVKYEDCRFSGILSFGVTKSVRFIRCSWSGASVMFAERGSTDTVFEACRFVGPSPDKNQQGTIGSEGEIKYLRCYAKWFKWAGDAKLDIEDCECENVSIHTDSEANSGVNFLNAQISVKNSILRGSFQIRSANLQSLSISDTNINNFDLSGSSIKGDVYLERVQGGYVNASAKSLGKLAMSQCQIFGRRRKFSFELGLAAADEVLIDQCNFGSDLNLSVGLGAGGPLENDEWQNIAKNRSTVIRNSTFPILDASWLESRHLRIENNTIESLDISNSRIGKLEVVDNRISLEVNLKNTQVEKSRIQPLAKGQAKLDGANIRLE